MEWRGILATMERYKRTDGFVDIVDGRLLFFDSDSCIGGVHVCHVSKAEVKDYAYGTDNDNQDWNGQGSLDA